jgi:hypothetical protein
MLHFFRVLIRFLESSLTPDAATRLSEPSDGRWLAPTSLLDDMSEDGG